MNHVLMHLQVIICLFWGGGKLAFVTFVFMAGVIICEDRCSQIRGVTEYSKKKFQKGQKTGGKIPKFHRKCVLPRIKVRFWNNINGILEYKPEVPGGKNKEMRQGFGFIEC